MPEGLMAVLQKRGKYNFEERKRESWPGGCQVTTHGKLQEEEDFKTALFREAAEELGEAAARLIRERANELVEVFHLSEKGKEVVTFALQFDFSFVQQIRLGPSTGGLQLVEKNIVYREAGGIQDLRFLDREDGARESKTIAMFPDELAALKVAFEHFSS